jgi:hypothetical protein
MNNTTCRTGDFENLENLLREMLDRHLHRVAYINRTVVFAHRKAEDTLNEVRNITEVFSIRFVCGMGEWLDMSISDDGQGVPATAVDRVFLAVHPRLHTVSLLRRRLQGLFGRSFRLEVGSEVGRGTTVRMCIPLRGRFENAGESLEARQF